MISPFQVRAPLTTKEGFLVDWAQKWFSELVANINASVQTIPGPYANNAAAAAAGVALGKPYYQASGAIFIRVP